MYIAGTPRQPCVHQYDRAIALSTESSSMPGTATYSGMWQLGNTSKPTTVPQSFRDLLL
uniref:Uncharacterized protein n=1 Tax=Arundo donax TaxID=35708 RepID=A0A0A8ZWU9_ARUDO